LRRLKLRVADADAGSRLDLFIATAGGISRGLARRTLDTGGVFLDGRRCKVASRTVRAGQSITVHLEEGGRTPTSPVALEPRRLLYADEDVAVVDKPPFVAAQPTLTTDRGALPELVGALLGAPVTLVHRLDRETSGVCIFARSARAAAALAEAFRTGTPEKTYLALTARSPTPPLGRIALAIGKDPLRPGRRRIDTDGDPAATRYRTLVQGQGGAAVECQLETGRTHQIRVHLAHLGAPLLGDARYGGPRRVLATSVPRVMLHARRLSLLHPVTGVRTTFEAPIPEDLAAIARTLIGDVS
jgi:23S rRNA pseudouridine1911/1915/1917 synthase